MRKRSSIGARIVCWDGNGVGLLLGTGTGFKSVSDRFQTSVMSQDSVISSPVLQSPNVILSWQMHGQHVGCTVMSDLWTVSFHGCTNLDRIIFSLSTIMLLRFDKLLERGPACTRRGALCFPFRRQILGARFSRLCGGFFPGRRGGSAKMSTEAFSQRPLRAELSGHSEKGGEDGGNVGFLLSRRRWYRFFCIIFGGSRGHDEFLGSDFRR